MLDSWGGRKDFDDGGSDLFVENKTVIYFRGVVVWLGV